MTPGVGTTASGTVEWLPRFPRRVPAHGGPSARFRRTLWVL